MGTKQPANAVEHKEIFYHALYHHIAHWAAYVAMMGLLVTTGLLVSLTPVLSSPDSWKRKTGVIVAIICSLAGAIYFIKGMDKYAGIMNTEYLPLS